MDIIKNLETLLAAGKDSALLRFGLGDAYLRAGHAEQAAAHLVEAVRLDPKYSAAWKLYGKALTEAGDNAAAMQAYATGITTAEAKGDVQAAKEMKVFLKRLQKQQGA